MAIAILQGIGGKVPQEKSIKIERDGNYTVAADEGFALDSVAIEVDTPDKKPEIEWFDKITANGVYNPTIPEGKVISRVSLDIDVPEEKPEEELNLGIIKTNGAREVYPSAGSVFSKVTFEVDVDRGTEQFDNRLDGIIALQKSYIGGGYKPSEGLEYKFESYINSFGVNDIGTCTDEIVVIPSEYEGYPVTGISNLWSTTMKELILPDSVTWTYSTVNNCTALERVVFGANFGSVNYWSFNGNVNCKVYDFSRCLQMPTIDLYDDPDYYVFRDMPDDCKIIVPAHLLDDWKRATNWTMFADHIVAAESVADNGTSSSESYETTEERLEAIEGNVPKVYEAGEEVYKGFKVDLMALIDRSITEIDIPEGATAIGMRAFEACRSLSRVTIPEGIQFVGVGGLMNTAVTELVFPDTLLTIDGYGCYGNANLTRCVFGEKIALIAELGFSNNSNCLVYDFTRVTKIPSLRSTNSFDGINADCKIYVPASLYDEWIAATNWSMYADYIVAK